MKHGVVKRGGRVIGYIPLLYFFFYIVILCYCIVLPTHGYFYTDTIAYNTYLYTKIIKWANFI